MILAPRFKYEQMVSKITIFKERKKLQTTKINWLSEVWLNGVNDSTELDSLVSMSQVNFLYYECMFLQSLNLL